MPTSFLFNGEPPPPFFRGTGPTFPDQDLVSMDDEQVKEILINLEIHSLFTAPVTPDPLLRGVTDDRHPTHRFLIVRWTGQPNDRDNGYVLLGWLRSRHSFDDVERLTHEFLAIGGDPSEIKVTKGG